MSTVSINSKNTTARHIRENLSDVYNSLHRLASGQKYNNPGQGVVEQNIARSVEVQRSTADITLDVVKDASNLLDSTYNVVSNIREGVLKQYQIAVTASSSTFGNIEDLQKQFSSLKDQIDYDANFNYNGLTLLNGSFSGDSVINTKLGMRQHYNISEIGQYVVNGNVGGGSFLEVNSKPIITDKLGKTQATASLMLSTPIADGDTFTINGVVFTAKTTVVNKATEFAVDANNSATIKNLVKILNSSTNTSVTQASYRYVNNLGLNANIEGVTIFYNELGTKGNSFTYAASGKNTIASQTLSGGTDYRAVADKATFVQDLYGNFEDFLMRFRNDDNGYNVVQFEARINGETYSTQEMILSVDDFGGFKSGGNKIVKGTTLYFQKVGAKETDIGFSIKVGDNDLMIRNTTDIDLIQEECAEIASRVAKELSNINLQINATVTSVDSFGLTSASQFVASGSVTKDNYLDDAVAVTGKVGAKVATGVIKITNNLVKNEDLTVNGETIYFGIDSVLGTTVTMTRDNLLSYLNSSTNENISKAFYTPLGTDSILVQSKLSGTEGNNFTLATTSNNMAFNNLSPYVKSVKLGDNSVQSNGTRADFTQARGSITLVGNATANSVLVFGTPSSAAVAGPATVVTFKTAINPSAPSPAGGPNQVAIGAAAADTALNLVAMLNSSTDVNISKARYEIDATTPTKVNVIAKAYGPDGNNFPLLHATSAAALTTSVAPAVSVIAPITGGTLVNVPPKGLSATGTIMFTALNGAQPNANDTVTINGVAFTFKTAVAAPTDVLIGANVNDTAYNLFNALNTSTNPLVQAATYSLIDTDTSIKHVPGIRITYKTPGIAGNTFTLATNVPAGTAAAPARIILNNANPAATTAAPTATLLGGADPFTNNMVLSGEDVISEIEEYSPLLKGSITNFAGIFVEGQGTNNTPNAVDFSAVVNNESYSGRVVLSGANFSGNTPTGSNYNGLGHLITKGTKIVLKSNDSTHGIVFIADQDISLNGTSKDAVDNVLTSVVSKMQDAIAPVKIMQERIVANFDESKADYTPLSGLKKEDVTIIDANFNQDGMGGKIAKFVVDNALNTISVKINDVLYSQKLSDSVALGGLGINYDIINKVIKGGNATTLTLKTADASDGKALKINLKNINEIKISTPEQASSLERALNAVFGTSSYTGLQFKVGAGEGEDSLFTINFRDMSSGNIYKDANGIVIPNLSIDNKEAAALAANVLENTLKDFNADLSSIGSSRNRFDSIADTLTSLIDSLDSSYSNLLDADVAEVSAEMIKNMLKVNSAALAQMHEMTILRELVSTLTSR